MFPHLNETILYPLDFVNHLRYRHSRLVSWQSIIVELAYVSLKNSGIRGCREGISGNWARFENRMRCMDYTCEKGLTGEQHEEWHGRRYRFALAHCSWKSCWASSSGCNFQTNNRPRGHVSTCARTYMRTAGGGRCECDGNWKDQARLAR